MRFGIGIVARVAAAMLAIAVCAASADAKPNIVLIFIDDMGYGDIGPFGSERATPHLERMAAEGAKFTDFYVSAVACTPSRSALMTGCYAERIGMGGGVVFPEDDRGMHPDEITLAEILKAEGYATGCFGKWHLGDQPEFMPLVQGFDEFEGIPYSNDMWVKGNPKHNFPPLPYMKQNLAVAHISAPDDQRVITDSISDATVDFIERHKDEPFFAYVPHSAVHWPFYVTQERLDAANGDVMTALVTEIDNSVGRVMSILEELGIATNTLVFFTNDNGGGNKTSNAPLRGGKFGPKYEGNMRVATLAWWPGTIPAGMVVDEIGRSVDILPTFANLAGGQVPTDRIIDGKDISELLLTPGAPSPTDTLYYQDGGVRQGQWKLVRYRSDAVWYDELYDLETDIGETNNLASLYPTRVDDMKLLLQNHTDAVAASKRSAGYSPYPAPILSDTNGLPTLREFYASTNPPSGNYLIVASAGANGSVNPSGAVNLAPGNDQLFTITPDAYYKVQDVRVDGVSVGTVSSYSFAAVTADHTISAVFAPGGGVTNYTITASAGANGSITPSGAMSIVPGSDQSFAFLPEAEYMVQDVLVDGVSVGPVASYSFRSVSATHSIYATFYQNTITITNAIGDHPKMFFRVIRE